MTKTLDELAAGLKAARGGYRAASRQADIARQASCDADMEVLRWNGRVNQAREDLLASVDPHDLVINERSHG